MFRWNFATTLSRSAAVTLVAIVMNGCGDKSPLEPTPTAEAPTLTARLAVLIDGSESNVAVAAVSRVRFDATVPTPHQGPLRYVMEFGDGIRSVTRLRITSM
jgi:predicted small lipoprotein YifL